MGEMMETQKQMLAADDARRAQMFAAAEARVERAQQLVELLGDGWLRLTGDIVSSHSSVRLTQSDHGDWEIYSRDVVSGDMVAMRIMRTASLGHVATAARAVMQAGKRGA